MKQIVLGIKSYKVLNYNIISFILANGLSINFIPSKAVTPLPCVLQPLLVSFLN